MQGGPYSPQKAGIHVRDEGEKKNFENAENGSPRKGSPQKGSPRRFQLSAVASPTSFKALTRLPTLAKVRLLEELSPLMGDLIKRCLISIYSHVTERPASEGQPYFYHSVASSVLYETFYNVLIKDADHGLKGASLLVQIRCTIEEIERALNRNVLLGHNAKNILNTYRAIFIVHHNILLKALQSARPELLEHLKRYQNQDIMLLNPICITEEEREHVHSSFPDDDTSSPRKRKTPQKLSANDKDVIGEFSQKKARKALGFDNVEARNDDLEHSSSEDEEPSWLNKKKVKPAVKGKGKEKSKEELDDLLSLQMESMLFGFNNHIRSDIAAKPAAAEPSRKIVKGKRP